jgi:hypothetical protein
VAGLGGVASASFVTLWLRQLLSALDVYTVWGLILAGLGVAVTARLSWVKSAVVVALFWLLSLALGVLPSLIGLNLGRVLGSGSGIGGGGINGGGGPSGASGGSPPDFGGAGGPPSGAP